MPRLDSTPHTNLPGLLIAALLCSVCVASASAQVMKKRKTKDAVPTKIMVQYTQASEAVQPPVRRVNADTDGDGKTNFVIARAEGVVNGVDQLRSDASLINRGTDAYRARRLKDKTAPVYDSLGTVGIQWWAGQQSGATDIRQVGDSSTDFVILEDFDGDGKADFSVWRPGPAGQAKFIILQSATNTIRYEFFGATGDDPTVTGDYDGDGKADPATFRCPTSTASQCYFFFRGSLNNPTNGITYVPWGHGIDGDFYANPGDFDGDGKMDFCLQRTAPGSTSQGQFVLLRSSDWGAEYITWGNNTDYIIPGDYDGDGKSDFCVRQTISGKHYYWVLTRTGAITVTQFGLDGDVSTPGDYDGDGKQDFALWREDQANADNNYFWVRKSSDGGLIIYEWGMGFDYPVANWYVH